MILGKLRALQNWWFAKKEEERKRLKSFIPLILYTIGFMYFIIYLSILNTVNRDHSGVTVKTWFGGDRPEVIAAREKEAHDIKASYSELRKRVSGGR